MKTMKTRQAAAAPVLLAAAAVVGALLLGVLVGHGPTVFDEAVARAIGRWCGGPACRWTADQLSAEIGWPFTTYLVAAVPLVVVGVLLLRTRGNPARRAVVLAIRVLLTLLVLAAVQEIASHLYGRVGPVVDPSEPATAYPSGAALLTAITWIGGGLVVTELRPGWRVGWWAATAVVLTLHFVIRVAASKHWTTDIAGSYLLAAGALALATRRTYRPE
jgi:membrane-associated phospholipid phosphatase